MGEERGVFDWLVCMTCKGLGEVSETGEALTDEQIIDGLRAKNRYLQYVIRETRRHTDHLQQQLDNFIRHR